jgi:hypothetical protein
LAGVTDLVGVQKPSEVLSKVEESVPDSHNPTEPIKHEAASIFANIQQIIRKNPLIFIAVIVLAAAGIFLFLTSGKRSRGKIKNKAKGGVKRLVKK